MPLRSWLTCLFVLLITFVFGTVYAHTGVIPDTLRLLVIAGPAALWLIVCIRDKRPLPYSVLDLPLATATLWLVVSALFAQDRRISLEMIWPPLAHILLFYLLLDLMRRGWEASFRVALLAAAILILLISAVELGAWYFGWLGQPGWFPANGLSIPPFYPRLDLALNISTIQGNWLAMLIPLVITGVLVGRNRIALAVLAAPLLLAEFLTLSRGGLLGALVAVALLAIFGLRRHPLSRSRLILGVVLLVAISAALMVGVWTAVSVRKSSDRGRVDIWNSALEMARDHPITGIGPGGFGRALRDYRDPDLAQDKIASAHNLFLQAAAETGVPGLLILFWLIGQGICAWRQSWRIASAERRLWLEGALAAFAAYGTHSLFDTFTFTSSLLPLLILGAFVTAQPEPEPVKEPQTERRLWISWAAIAGFAIYIIMLFRFDVAQGWMTLSRRAIEDGDLSAALDRAEKAQSWDPWLSLYDLQHAYVLGLMANDDPAYVEQAITEYEDALVEDPTYDIGWVNLAALYRQSPSGVYATAARRALTHASNINPQNPLFWFERGNVQRALKEDADLAEYAADINRTGIVDFVLDESISPGKRLYVAVLVGSNSTIMTHKMDWYSAGQLTSATIRLVDEAKAEGNWMADMAVGMYEHRLGNNDNAAIRWLTRAIEQHSTDERPWIERAEIYLERGNLDDAESDARAALFADAYEGAYANAILAHIEEQCGADNDTVERLLKDSVRPRPTDQYFAGSVYGRPAAFDYLPQVNVPALIPPHYYDGWFELAKRYEGQGKIDEARQVYEDILDENPFLTQASDALKALPANDE